MMTYRVSHLMIVLVPAFLVLIFHPSKIQADELLTPELIQATEQQARKTTEIAHQYMKVYNEVHRDLDAHGLHLKSGVILSEQYRKRLNNAKAILDQSGRILENEIVKHTGNRGTKAKTALELVNYWGRELYGFGNLKELENIIDQRKNIIWLFLVIAGLIMGLFARRLRSSVNHNTPFQVPENLQRVQLPGLNYKVGWLSGLIADKEMWTEIKQEFHTTTDNFGNRITSTSTTSEIKGLLYVITQDGQEQIFDLAGADHRFHPGNLITIINFAKGKGVQFLQVFNHDSKEQLDYGLWTANGTPWLINLIVLATIAHYGFEWAYSPGLSVAAPYEHQFWVDTGYTAFAAVLVTLIIHLLITIFRNFRFRRVFQKKAEKYIDENINELRKSFSKYLKAPGSN
jgi:hypothetical protein